MTAIVNIAGHGRSCVTERTLDPGDIVSVEKALASVVLWGKRNIVCWACLEEGLRLRKCSRCGVAMYCSTQCQKYEWQQHKFEVWSLKNIKRLLQCQHLPSVSTFFDLNDHQATLAILCLRLLLSTNCNHVDFALNLSFPPFDLSETWQSNIETFALEIFDNSKLRTFKDATLAKLHDYFIEEKITALGYEDFKSIFSRFQMNSFYLANSLFQPVAAGIYTKAAFYNHSCLPNTVPVYDCKARIQTFKAIRQVAAGEEITHSYVDLARSTRERQVILMKDYGFKCDCKYCNKCEVRELRMDEFLESVKPYISPQHLEPLLPELWNACIGNSDVLDVDSCLYVDKQHRLVAEEELEGFDDVPEEQRNRRLHYELMNVCRQLDGPENQHDKEKRYESHILALRQLIPKFNFFNRCVYSMLSECYSLALELGYNEEALEMIQRLVIWNLGVYRCIPHHPVATLLLFSLGQLKVEVAKDKIVSSAVLRRVITSLNVLHGGNHPYIQIAESLLLRAADL
eukprot:Gregarina_sp_Poly_1__5100@NODE_26_length_19795_cov_50_913828_g24_i0_p3_GENE_NODE_26_length_19795_cov_50_913828_g24_i0NODE_26_length_19795_cov_50_913828_g24_i0_p3_ORF_typecomplete_len514_score51_26SET/PF00856_28/9_4e13SET/PF00856_28/2e03zfMYND/PF01753_18/8_1e09zfMYND/PF01753_18/1_7e04zfC6H2/PF15801_5/0_058zfC6H2/PF15801_5/3_1e03zfMss51/PF13824_6/0_28zfMss51/PF13824_6/1_2e04_NODE_26_length_19795_cov_50_913828_g24_i01577117312